MNEVIYVQIGEIHPNPSQPRKHFKAAALGELADSIRQYGILQPLTVRPSQEGYELVAGERRLRAAGMAGLDFVPVVVKTMTDNDSAVVAMIENLQREDLDFLEEAMGYKRLIEHYGMTQTEVAKAVGKGQSTVANKLRLLKLSAPQRNEIRLRGLTERHARALLKLDGEKDRDRMIGRIAKHDWNVRQTEEAVERLVEKREKKVGRQSFKTVLNMRIYTNTLKRAFKEILKTGIQAEYEEGQNGAYYEVKIRIPLR